MDSSYDLIIVGYGPVGQTLALLLGQKGYHVGVFERYPDLFPLPRAVHFDDEVACVLQTVGVSWDELEPFTLPLDTPTAFEFQNAGGETLLRMIWGGPGRMGWPSSTGFSQPGLESILDRHVKLLPAVEVYQGCEVVQLLQHSDGVELTARNTTGELQKAHSRYLVGADGANSFVRQHMQTSVTDLGFFYNWLVVDVEMHEPRAWVPLGMQICDPDRPITVVPSGKKNRRWEFMQKPGEDREDLIHPEKAWQLLKPFDVTAQNATLLRNSVYTFQASWAEQWRDGRLLLAGDAAHQMPPFAAQGFCSGICDAISLAWRLDVVLADKGSDTLLDTYTSERKGHVCHAIMSSVEAGRLICITDPEQAAQRDAMMLAAMEHPEMAPPPPPPPHLGPGTLQNENPLAGQLFIQDHVVSSGKSGLFDDMVGRGFCLLSVAGDPAATLSEQTQAVFTTVGGLSAYIVQNGAEGQVVDLNGAYHDWFATNDCAVVLTRPDFVIFGPASTLDGTESLLKALLSHLHTSLPTE